MTAEVRQVGNRTWMIDLACSIEQCWEDDRIGAGMAAEDHNEEHHQSPYLLIEADEEFQVAAA